MNFYSILFDRLYVVFTKTGDNDPGEGKFDGAVLTPKQEIELALKIKGEYENEKE